jgi:CBS domain-containing protein
VKDVMSKNIASISPEESVSKLISLIEKYRLREILIIDRKKLKGIVYSKDIAKKGITDPTKVKISSLMKFPPHSISPNDKVEDAAKLMFDIGLRALPVIENKKVVGVLSIFDIMKVAMKTEKFKKTKVENIMSTPEIITEDTDIGKARFLMREKNISRLPVIDKEKRLCGLVTIFDILKAIKPRERINWYSMAAEKETIMGIPVSTILDTEPLIVDRKTNINEVAKLMIKNKTDGVIIAEDNFPIGVVTTKDLLELYVLSLKKKGIFYQIVGLTDEDDFIVNTIDRMIRDTIRKLSNIFKPQFFVLHIKKYDRNGKRKYSIRVRFATEKRTFVSKAYAWDLRDAVDKALDRLERIMLKRKGIRNKIREKVRFTKMFR